MKRRQFLKYAGAAGVTASVAPFLSTAAANAATAANARTATRATQATRATGGSRLATGTATQLAGVDYTPKFTAQLPRPPRLNLDGLLPYAIMDIRQFTQQVLTGYPPTTLYGYAPAGGKPSWPGPTITARSHWPAYVTWRNQLPQGSLTLAQGGHLLPVDDTLLDPTVMALPAGEIPVVPHLHGGHTEWESDGYPEAWFTQSGHRGDYWRKQTYTFDNSQVGGTLWYHDHTLGITRLNVFAGLAGMYLLHDTTEDLLTLKSVLPATPYQTELVMQDRWFTDDGQLYMEVTADPDDGIEASIDCDFMMVNGTPWPVMDVEPRKYRFRLLNGSDSRFYVLQLDTGGGILVVGTELGLLPAAVEVERLPFAPGERYDIVLDFTGMAGATVTVLNNSTDGAFRGFGTGTGPTTVVTNRPTDPALGRPTNPDSTGKLMQFRVSRPLSRVKNATVAAGTPLGPALPKLSTTRTRGVMAFHGTDGQGRGMEMLGSLAEGTAMWDDPVTEVVTKGTTEIWEFYNTGPVAHPIHLHLVDFQVLDRASFTYTSMPMPMSDGGTGAMITITGTGTPRPPELYEVGRKDTVICYPGEVTRFIANFDRAGHYVWHCHILHHEDHMMMRPLLVQ